MPRDAEERAYMILKLFMEGEELSGELVGRVHAWLLDEANADAKERAMMRIFMEIADKKEDEEDTRRHFKVDMYKKTVTG